MTNDQGITNDEGRSAGRCAAWAVALLLAAGCGGGKQPKLSQLAGRVTFKGQPVPAGYITFQCQSGPVKSARITNGAYDTATMPDPGVVPGPAVIRISGFNGQKEPYFHDGKQIFNPYTVNDTIPDGTTTKDFEVPASAANNLKIERTADIP